MWITIHHLLQIEKNKEEEVQVREKKMVVNVLEVFEVGFIEMKISVSSSLVAVAPRCVSYQLMPLCVD